MSKLTEVTKSEFYQAALNYRKNTGKQIEVKEGLEIINIIEDGITVGVWARPLNADCTYFLDSAFAKRNQSEVSNHG